jgi:glycine dehydrogenase subunit 2
VPFLRRGEDGFRLVEHLGEAPSAFGRIAAFHGQMGMFVRALAYMLSHGADGLGRRGRRAECELYPRKPQGSHVRTFRRQALHARGFVRRDMAEAHWPHNPRFTKAMIDEGLSLVAHGAMLIEPTESESKAPHYAPRRRLTRAARLLILKWTKPGA